MILKAINQKGANCTIVMFNMSGFQPTVESEENFKRCSNFMKNIHFGYVDVQNLHEEIHDATGKQSKK